MSDTGSREPVVTEQGSGGLTRIIVNTPHGSAMLYVQGAHLAHYQPAGQRPLLFMSEKSLYEPGRPIRGGVPICFPWFGPRAGDPGAGLHGFARLLPWTLESTIQEFDGSVSVVLRLDSTEQTQAIWPHAFSLCYRLRIGPSLEMTLETTNSGDKPFTFEEALHTYFAVADVREVSITGLEETTYLDKPDGMKAKMQDKQPIRITAETDRVYLNTRSTCTIHDTRGGRRIIIEKSGSDTTVVWNPWIAKAKAMPDFGDDEWTKMLCIETANANRNAVTLAPGECRQMRAVIRSELI